MSIGKLYLTGKRQIMGMWDKNIQEPEFEAFKQSVEHEANITG